MPQNLDPCRRSGVALGQRGAVAFCRLTNAVLLAVSAVGLAMTPAPYRGLALAPWAMTLVPDAHRS